MVQTATDSTDKTGAGALTTNTDVIEGELLPGVPEGFMTILKS